MRKELNRYPYPGFRDAAADADDDDTRYVYRRSIYSVIGGMQVYKLYTEVGFVL